MIHPANDKVVALSAVAGEALFQGAVLKLIPGGDGRLTVLKAAATADYTAMGTFLAYYISPDSQDTDFTGGPETATFTLNTGTGIGGGMHNIPSGADMVALGGSKTALVRIDGNSLYGTPASLAAYTAGLLIEAHTTGYLALVADSDLAATAARVIANDGKSIVVQLA
jgi:hypothetical protein